MKVAALLCSEIDQNSIVFGSKQERDKREREDRGEKEKESASEREYPIPQALTLKRRQKKKEKTQEETPRKKLRELLGRKKESCWAGSLFRFVSALLNQKESLLILYTSYLWPDVVQDTRTKINAFIHWRR